MYPSRQKRQGHLIRFSATLRARRVPALAASQDLSCLSTNAPSYHLTSDTIPPATYPKTAAHIEPSTGITKTHLRTTHCTDPSLPTSSHHGYRFPAERLREEQPSTFRLPVRVRDHIRVPRATAEGPRVEAHLRRFRYLVSAHTLLTITYGRIERPGRQQPDFLLTSS